MRFCIAISLLFSFAFTHAQVPAQAPRSLQYEVASIKESPPGAGRGQGRPEPGGVRYRGTNLPLRSYIFSAYRINADQLAGEPTWVDTVRFDIEAQAEKPSTLEEHHLMMRSLLAQRFHLQFHWEAREMPIYALTVSESGPKLTLHDSANAGEAWIEQSMNPPLHATWKAVSSSMELFTYRLAAVMDRPVVDQTGLQGEYDFTLTYTMDLPPNIQPNGMINGEPIDTSGPSIFQAVRQQLGLRLEARKGPVQVLVVDHVEKPSGN
jgi:uncharacterized protein (TIGR03435 family)